MLMFTLAISCLTTFNLPLFTDITLQVPMQYCSYSIWLSLPDTSTTGCFYFGSASSFLHPLQCSCLENPRDGGAWWAAVYGAAQSWTQLKWLSSSSSRSFIPYGYISLLFSRSTLNTYWHGGVHLSVMSFCLFLLFMGFSRQECWSGLPFHSPIAAILSLETNLHIFTLPRLVDSVQVRLPFLWPVNHLQAEKQYYGRVHLIDFFSSQRSQSCTLCCQISKCNGCIYILPSSQVI